MVFSSIEFLFYFLPIVLLIYYIVPKGAKNFVLLVASLAFYAWGAPDFFLIFIVSVVIYTFRDLGVPIVEQILQTPFYIIVLICISAFLYEVVEGWITCTLSKIYNPEFSLLSGIACSLYCCFYRP